MPTRQERALEILQEGADLVNKEYYEAIVNETLPQHYLDEFLFKRLYSDDLPGEELVDFWHPDYPMMKCRGNCIVGIALELGSAVSDGVIKDDEIIDLVKLFKEYDWNFQKGAKGTYWTSSEEIDFINNVLDTVITHLMQSYSLECNTGSIKQKFQDQLSHRRKQYDF